MAYLSDNFDFASTALAAIANEERVFQAPTYGGGARVRCTPFGFNTGTAGIDVSEYDGNGLTDQATVALAVFPRGAKILVIHHEWEAMGANADLDLGLFDIEGTEIDKDLYVDGGDVATASTGTVYPAMSATAGEEFAALTQTSVLVATALTADWAADKDYKGWVLWIDNT